MMKEAGMVGRAGKAGKTKMVGMVDWNILIVVIVLLLGMSIKMGRGCFGRGTLLREFDFLYFVYAVQILYLFLTRYIFR